MIISPWKSASYEQTWITFNQKCFVPSLVEIGPIVLENKMEMWKVYDKAIDSANPNDNTNFNVIDNDRQRTTFDQKSHWVQKGGLTLTFEHVTLKSRGVIFSLRATPVPSLVLIKWRGQKILSNTVGSKEWFDLTFEHVTWKSIGNFYLFRATSAPS